MLADSPSMWSREVMSDHLSRVHGWATLVAAFAAIGVPMVSTGPIAAAAPASSSDPATDSQGFVDSSARCTTPDVAVAYGSTAGSKVAICQTSVGKYEYHGVRLRDGARLVIAAASNGSGGFVAHGDGITYTLTSNSLDISDASGLIRSEPVMYFRSAGGIPPASVGASAGAPVTPVTGAPTAAPTTPLPPPLSAEVGGKSATR